MTITLITQKIWITGICICLIAGIECAKLFFPVVMKSWDGKDGKGSNIVPIALRGAAVLLSALCTFVLISGDVQSPNETAYKSAIETHYKEILAEQRASSAAVQSAYDNAVKAEIERHNQKVQSMEERFTAQIISAQEPMNSIDASSTYAARIKEINASVKAQVEVIDKNWQTERSDEAALHNEEMSRIEAERASAQIIVINEADVRERATQLALVDYPAQGKNKAIEATVEFVTGMFRITMPNMYEAICLLLSLMIAIIAESIIIMFSNKMFQSDGENAQSRN